MDELRTRLREALTDQELIVLGYGYNLNHRGVHLRHTDLANMLNVTPSRLTRINGSLIKKLQRLSLKDSIKALVEPLGYNKSEQNV